MKVNELLTTIRAALRHCREQNKEEALELSSTL